MPEGYCCPVLKGEIRCQQQLPHRYRIIERNAGFEQQGTGWLRHNEIWRETVAKGQDAATLSTDFLYANRSRTMYEPATTASPPMEPAVYPSES
jgi:hypothetical protein